MLHCAKLILLAAATGLTGCCHVCSHFHKTSSPVLVSGSTPGCDCGGAPGMVVSQSIPVYPNGMMPMIPGQTVPPPAIVPQQMPIIPPATSAADKPATIAQPVSRTK